MKLAPFAPDPWSELKRFTPARIALGRCGGSLPTREVLDFALSHARARDAVHVPLDMEAMRAAMRTAGFDCIAAHSAAGDRAHYLMRPDLGRRLDRASAERLVAARQEPAPELAFLIGDGLSSAAIQRHAIPVLQAIWPRLAGWRIAPIVLAEQSRVALGDEVGELLGAELIAVLIGERPGLSSPDSLGIYVTHGPRVGRTDAERNCISNIRPEGLTYAMAAARLHALLDTARRLRLTGVRLKDTGAEALESDFDR